MAAIDEQAVADRLDSMVALLYQARQAAKDRDWDEMVSCLDLAHEDREALDKILAPHFEEG